MHWRVPALQTPPKFHGKTPRERAQRVKFQAGKKREILGVRRRRVSGGGEGSGGGRDTLPSWHGGCLSCMVIASVAVLLLCGLPILESEYRRAYAVPYFTVKLETGDPQDLKYGVYRIIGSGATVQSVSRCLLVHKMSTPLIHDEMKKLERWNHLISECSSLCLRRRGKRDTCVVPDFSPRLIQRETHFDTFETT